MAAMPPEWVSPTTVRTWATTAQRSVRSIGELRKPFGPCSFVISSPIVPFRWNAKRSRRLPQISTASGNSSHEPILDALELVDDEIKTRTSVHIRKRRLSAERTIRNCYPITGIQFTFEHVHGAL